MCGIVGIFNRQTLAQPELDRLRHMRDTIAYRGPDQAGEFIQGPIALGIRRLSIIDLKSGTQPISSADGRYTIVYNGEIYNYRQLRQRLTKQFTFHTSSDTEVLLYHYIRFGPEGLSQLNGMFACAIWDNDTHELFLARDRFGKKPLYYQLLPDNTFVFGSEIKTILDFSKKRPALDRQALTRYLLFEYIPDNDTPFTPIKKVPAGGWLRIHQQQIEQKQWWNVYPYPTDYQGDFSHPKKTLDELLNQAVHDRMIADVPVGVLLSGGIDSTTITWYMRQHTRHLHSFSVGFEDKSFNESGYAKLAAQSLQTEHHHVSFTLDSFHQALEAILPKLDEPLADASLLPSYIVSREAKRHVTVVLDGDGADELFYGYDTFPAYELSLHYQRLPKQLKTVFEQIINTLPTSHRYFSWDFRLKSFLRGMPFPNEIRNQVWLGSFSDKELTNVLTTEWQAGLADLYQPIVKFTRPLTKLKPLERLSLVYLVHYLQGDLLPKIDRATMYASLEGRTPFLDPRLVSFVLQLPQSAKYRFPQGKRILRSLMRGRIPQMIVDRKKQGFGIPLGVWLRGPLRQLMESTLSPAKLEAVGIVRPEAVATLIREHLQAKADHRKKLWTLMILHWWWKRWVR